MVEVRSQLLLSADCKRTQSQGSARRVCEVVAANCLLTGCVGVACRLAMIAFLGFCSQAANTGVGPLQNLKDHIADPVHKNSAPLPE